MPSAQEEEKPSTLFSILQAGVIALMLTALMGRCAAYINSQPAQYDNITYPETLDYQYAR